MAVITLTDYKAAQGMNSPNNDGRLQPIVDSVNALIERYCQTSFSEVTVTDERLTNSGYIIMLNNAPVTTVSSVAIVRASDEVITSDQYIVFPEEGIIELIDYTIMLPTNPRSFKVTYNYGYAVVPTELERAAIELITYYDKREFDKSKDLGNGQSINFADTSVLPRQVRTILDQYRLL